MAITASLAASDAQARITRIDVTQTESPTFGGFSWPEVGQYEKIVGVTHGEVNPLDPKNAVITDIKLAPRNARGNVEYAFDFYILKPIDLSKGAHKMNKSACTPTVWRSACRHRRRGCPPRPRCRTARAGTTVAMTTMTMMMATTARGTIDVVE